MNMGECGSSFTRNLKCDPPSTNKICLIKLFLLIFGVGHVCPFKYHNKKQQTCGWKYKLGASHLP